MKFTKEDLMKALGLQVGDRIKVKFVDEQIFEIKTVQGVPYLHGMNNLRIQQHALETLIGRDFEILPRPMRVGDLKCGEIEDCRTCPLQWLCFKTFDERDEMEETLYEVLDSFAVEDQEINDLLKARLDKEVSNND